MWVQQVTLNKYGGPLARQRQTFGTTCLTKNGGPLHNNDNDGDKKTYLKHKFTSSLLPKKFVAHLCVPRVLFQNRFRIQIFWVLRVLHKNVE